MEVGGNFPFLCATITVETMTTIMVESIVTMVQLVIVVMAKKQSLLDQLGNFGTTTTIAPSNQKHQALSAL